MGGYDMYCCICGLPFNHFYAEYYPPLKDIDTTWLNGDVIVKSTTKSYIVNKYDGYGSFDMKDGSKCDIGLSQCDGLVKVYHKCCEGKDPTCKMVKKYQQQYFDIEQMISNNDIHLLNKPT
jgi:hypothetical protein